MSPRPEIPEDQLDALVSFAIRRAEILGVGTSPEAFAAWREVLAYEEQLAVMTSPDSVRGGLARVGAIVAALGAGDPDRASLLADRYLAEEGLPEEDAKRLSCFDERR
jgi:hypothetical protein